MLSLTRRHFRIALGLLWIVDAALQARPHFFGFDWWHNDVAQSVMGQPEPVSRSILWTTGHLAHHALAANVLVIAVQAAIGLALILGRFERAAIATSFAWALCVWWIGEGFGGLATGFALLPGGAPGAVLLYPLVGFLAWPRPSPDEPVRELPVRAWPAAGAWFAIWVGGGLLELPWRFPADQVLQANIEEHGLGQPHWLSDVSHGVYQAVGDHPLLIPALVILAQFAVGAGVLVAPARRYAIGAGAVLTMVFWIVVEDFGSIASGDATDPGSGPLLLLVALVVASAFASRATATSGSGTSGSGTSGSGLGSEEELCSSTSRITRLEPNVSGGTTSTWTASPYDRSAATYSDASGTCTTSSSIPSATSATCS